MRIIDHFDNGVKYYPENIAFVDVEGGGGEITYSKAFSNTHEIACALDRKGYSKGAHIGILAPNSSIAFLALLGVFRAGSVWLPINPRNPVDVNVDLFDRFDGELLLYHSSYEREAEEIFNAVDGIKDAVCIDSRSTFGSTLNDWVTPGDQYLQSGETSSDDVMAIFPTGGTTGKSKGVVLTHRAIDTMYQNYYAHFSYYDDTKHLVVAPMTHSAGIIGGLHFARGGTNVVMEKASPELICDAIENYGITHLFLPPTVLYMMLALPDVRDRNYSSLQHFLVGAAPTSIEKLKEALSIFGPVMTEAFGQSEAPASITAKAPWDYMNPDGSV